MNLARDLKGNKKGFYRSISCKRSMREYAGLLLSRAGDLVTGNREKAEVLRAFLPSVFTGKTGCGGLTLAGCQVPTKATLSLPLLSWTGGDNKTKGSWVKIRAV